MRTITLFFVLFIMVSCTKPNPEKEMTEPQEPAISTTAKEAPEEVSYLVSMEYLLGKFDPATHSDFALVKPPYTNRDGMYLRKDTYEAFKKMHAAATEDGVRLVIRSATRNFQSQKGIWEGKWNGTRKIENGKDASVAYPDPKTRALKILEYSSMPSTSRHHWGTDIDLNNFTNEWFEQGEGLKIYTWLQANGAKFGFCQPYTAKGDQRPNGYNEERWHWSYMPISKQLTQQARSQMKNELIQGFLGAEVASEIDVVSNYVLGINHACLE